MGPPRDDCTHNLMGCTLNNVKGSTDITCRIIENENDEACSLLVLEVEHTRSERRRCHRSQRSLLDRELN